MTADVPPVKADRQGIERVILNVLSNAIKYTPEEGNIKIYVGFVYNDAYIKVIDSGIGIPKEDLNRIFERFYEVVAGDDSNDSVFGRHVTGENIGEFIAELEGQAADRGITVFSE